MASIAPIRTSIASKPAFPFIASIATCAPAFTSANVAGSFPF